MFGNQHFARVHQLFEDQFESEGESFLYRRNMKAAPIRVTEAERDGFVADFKGRFRYLIWGMVPATLMLIALLVALGPDPDSVAGEFLVWIGMGIILAIFLAVHFWVWNAPARALVRRPVLGTDRTRAEVGKLKLERISYGQLAFAPLIAVFVGSRAFDRNGLVTGWSAIWLLLAGALVVLAAVQAFRKWNNARE